MKIKIKMIAAAQLLPALLLSVFMGCATLGPISSPEFPNLVNNSIPANDGKVLIAGRGTWHPNILGFTDVYFGGIMYGIQGVCVITDSSLVFLQWFDPTARYEIVKRIANSEMLSVSLDSYGNLRRMVVQKRNFSADSFSFLGDRGVMVDNEKVETATALLLNQLAR